MNNYCKTCGYSFSEFQQSGQLGCADCYIYFRINEQISDKHKGIIPDNYRKYYSLKSQLQNALINNNFDLVKKIKIEMNKILEVGNE